MMLRSVKAQQLNRDIEQTNTQLKKLRDDVKIKGGCEELEAKVSSLCTALLTRTSPTADKEKTLAQAKRLLRIQAQWMKYAPNEAAQRAFFTHYRQVEFLFDTRLIFSIIAQQTCSRDQALRAKHLLKVDEKGLHVLEKSDDRTGSLHYMSVDTLMDKTQFKYDDEKACLVDSTGQSWNYFLDGLEAKDRWESDDFPPVAQITKAEQQTLLAHARRFWTDPAHSSYEVHRDPSQNPQQDTSVLQIFMCPRDVLNKNKSYFPLHAAIRLIDEDGQVYSTGFGSTIEEDKFNIGLRNYLATINGMPTLMDYEESRADEGRVVVSMSISDAQRKLILAKLKEYRTQGIRFNILLQNCTRLAVQVLSFAGVVVDNKANSLWMTLSQLLPAPLTHLVNKVQALYSRIPKVGRVILKFPFMPLVLLYRAIACLALVCFGGTKGSPILSSCDKSSACSQPPSSARNPKTDHHAPKDLATFKSALESVRDTTRDPLRTYHSTPLIRWMLAQSTARFAPYQGTPDMRIHADTHDAATLKRLQRIYRVFPEELASRTSPLDSLSTLPPAAAAAAAG